MPSLPDLPILLCQPDGALRLSQDGEIEELDTKTARKRLTEEPHILCHKPGVIRRLGGKSVHPQSADVLELFAFVLPARFCAPSPAGLAIALEMPPPKSATQSANFLYQAAGELLQRLGKAQASENCAAIAHAMTEAGWAWGESVLEALGNPAPSKASNHALQFWRALPEWKETPPRNSKGEHAVARGEASERLSQLLGEARVPRKGQFDYAEGVASAFAPREEHDAAQIVLAEAGTGIGKTLGYLAPADIWARRNEAPVWISTYTKNLQHQLQRETRLLFDNIHQQKNAVVLRKGRHNYLCLLRLEEWLAHMAPMDFAQRIQAGLVARWAQQSIDGAVIGGDFPDWLLGEKDSLIDDIRDRNQECIHAACSHYRKCFAENIARRARKASLVLANHALVMTRMARSQIATDNDDVEIAADFPPRFIFDEGQHLFDVADGIFSLHCSGNEMTRMRNWLIGAETSARSSRKTGARGLRARVQTALENEPENIADALAQIAVQARLLPSARWREQLQKGAPQGEGEAFLHQVRALVLERSRDDNPLYSLDISCDELPEALLESATALSHAMAQLQKLLEHLCRLLAQAVEENDSNAPNARAAVETLLTGIGRQALLPLSQWRVMLSKPILAIDSSQSEAKYLDLFSLERRDGREVDIGMHRHWIDPTEPFARQLLEPSQGALITSATLHDGSAQDTSAEDAPDESDENNKDGFDWKIAEMRTGAAHLAVPPRRFSIDSPFDYKEQTRVFLINDVNEKNVEAVASAYGDLFLAAGGGSLGLFTSIARLRETYKQIAPRLQSEGIDLFAQHVDAMDTATLMDVFRLIEASCLLGCDAVRDGVDVPGRSLRMVVLERLPWPRSDVLHRARRNHFGKRAYDLMLTRFRLRQAFGRLIRSETDRGVFALLRGSLPGGLRAAFPAEVSLEECPLKDAILASREFLQSGENNKDPL